MNTRRTELKVGQVVYDFNKKLFGVLVILKDGKATLNMDALSHDREKLPMGWCRYENKIMFDCEAEKEPGIWETEDLNALYQVAWGIKDDRTGNLVCYEHTDECWDYYSPYLEENLDESEIYEI